MTPISRNAPKSLVQRGVTLIELMVGMTIGLIAVVIITQVMVLAEGQKRTTVSGSDAQVNGALALNLLQRDVRMAGFGFANNPTGLGCQIHGSFNAGAANTLTPADSWTLAPVRIVNGADGAPDSIRVMMSNARNYSVPMPTAETHTQTGTVFKMANDMRPFHAQSDVMLVIPGNYKTVNNPALNWCSLFSLFPVPGVGSEKDLPHTADATGRAPWNPVAGVSIFPATGYPVNSIVVNMGRFVNREFKVEGNQLMRSEFSSATNTFTSEAIFPQIVNLQAVYGKDTTLPNPDGIVDVWDNVQPTTTDGWQRIVAVRVALVARSGQREVEQVTTAPPTWHPDMTNSTAVDIVLSADADWKYYRYKVYEAVIPLRNVIWHAKLEDE